ncbi:integrin alpha-6-like [Mya arenaria]|uniref:integrin alpha-6-like n=1 Tax=Mya arenaria TaxID=6604 RepID=UPI0022E526A0|nr:integrin alpha-6-like [Mya arenaria]
MSNLMAGCPKTILLHTCVLTCVILIHGFNLDTSIPVVKKGPDNSYFGFSVAQHQELKKFNASRLSDEVIGNYILVGAPNLNIAQSNENNTGGIFKCNALSTLTNDCQLLLQDEYASNSQKDPGRENQWLGVVVRSGGAGKGVAACAHRYKEIKTNPYNIYGLGSCYQLSQDLQYDAAMGIGNLLTPCKGLAKSKEHEEYGFCQTGISAYVTEDEHLVMGSPGAINWRGMLSEVDVAPTFAIKRMYRSPTIDSDPVLPPVPLISYLGYSSVGGKFDNTDRMYYVSGAPRSFANGQVVFFTEMTSGNFLSYDQSQILSGELPFSGFGHEVLAVDLNNDGYDDLVVGCPYYFNESDSSIRVGGAVYVYIGNGDMITQYTKPQVIKGRTVNQEDCNALKCLHARFGFSLSRAGDLNKDSYQDFAVGAPYEGSGAVYIYHGSAKGVKEPFSQRIYATDLEDATGWSTFGYSLSGGMDLDQNSYPDLLVGSYVDNKVAFLRTRPIINLHSKVTVSPDKLNMSSSAHRSCSVDSFMYYCVEIKLCLRYTAEPVERFNDPVDIIYTITAEPSRFNSRVHFHVNQDYTQSVEDTFRLLSQSQTGLPDARDPKFSCVTQTAYLKSQFTDVLNPIEFGISYNLPERTEPIPTTSPGALPDINEHPILDTGLTQAETMVISKVKFVKKCGEDDICQSNLLMTIDLPDLKKMNNKYVLEIGDQTVLRVAVEVENKGEIAYQASFFLVKPESLVWKNSVPAQGEIGCFSVNSTLIECNEFGSKEMGKPLFAGDKKNFDLFFQIKKSVMSTVRSFEMTGFVNTSSEELTKESDTLVIPITVFVNADLQVSGQSEPDSAIPYSGDIRGESAMENERMIGPSVNHTFTVYNNGPGTVEASEITIFWPYEVQSTYPHGKHLLYLMNSPQVISGDATCFDQPEIINVVGIEEDYSTNKRPRTFLVEGSSGDPGYTVQNKRRRREVNSVDNKPMEVREEEPKIGEARERKNIALLDCDRNTAKCYEIRCKLGILEPYNSVKIRLRSRLWESTLLEDFRHVDEVHIRSKAKIFIRPELNVLQEDTKNDVTYARTVAIPSIRIVQEKPLEWWIYALAILGGLVLLVLLALCLWKCGFFKRQRYDSMTTYNVKVEKKRDIKNPTHNTKVETHKDYIDENEVFLKH